MSKILITGGSGLIGTRLTEILTQQGYTVSHLGRSKRQGKIPSFVWDINKGIIDAQAFEGIETVIHLAGAGVADKRWTEKRKKELLESRTKSTSLLAKYLDKNTSIKTVVCASAIGYYGFGSHMVEFTEADPSGSDYLAQVVKAWEDEIDKIKNRRVVKLRTGIVLSNRGGALKQMATPVRWGVGAPLGSGMQHVSWIHLDDLCRMFIKAIKDASMQGIYNATGPYAVTNHKLTKAIATALNKPLWLLPIPAWAINIALGEMGEYVLQGSIVSSEKIQKTGFEFLYPKLDEALENLLLKSTKNRKS
jgi:uncharacterized protein (TIGR01777 family)